MAFYTGEVAAKDLYTTLVNKITAVHDNSTSAWWKKESSLDSDGIFTSKGSSGNERIVLILKEGTIGKHIEIGVAKDYTPGAINTAGALSVPISSNLIYFQTVVDQYNKVKYNLSITADRVIIHIQGDKLVSNWRNPVAYLGMPVRYDSNDNKCVLYALSESSIQNSYARLIEDSIGVNNANYTWHYIGSPSNPSWGNTYFVETLHFGKANEGLRGELDGLYGTNPTNLVDGDEIDINGIRFLVIKRVAEGSNSFPHATLLLRKS